MKQDQIAYETMPQTSANTAGTVQNVPRELAQLLWIRVPQTFAKIPGDVQTTLVLSAR